jgi:pimeloyl-ACP methyl ester carboxylesterase
VKGYVAQVELFMDQMGIGRVPVIGHGLGGVVALNFALAHPDRVEQLLAVAMPLLPDNIARPLSGFAGGENPARTILGRKLKDYNEVDMEANKTDGAAVVQSVRDAMSQDLAADLEDIESPVLLVYGRDDPLIESPDDDVLEDLDFNVYSIFFDGVQHYPMLEDTSKFNRLLRDFLMHKDNWDAYQVKDEWRRRMR